MREAGTGSQMAAEALREAVSGQTFLRHVTTGSMCPTLQPGDLVRFARSPLVPRPGEIWAFASASHPGQHIAHRVLWRREDGRVLTKGDNLLRPDGWIAPERLFGPALERLRGGQWRPLTGRRRRAVGLLRTAVGSLRLAAGALVMRGLGGQR